MARRKKKYRAAPITEAVYEVFVEPRAELDWSHDTAVAIRDALDGFTGRQEELREVEMKVALRPDELQHSVRHARPRFRWWHEKDRRAIQAGANMCSHNVLPPYSEYETYVPTTERLFSVFLEQTSPARIVWTGQRYINEVQVPVTRSPANYFTIYPAIESAEYPHPNMALQVETAKFDDVSTVTNLVFRRADENVAVYVIDIYSRSTQQLEPTPGSLMEWHGRAHATISQSFEFAITDAAREAFEEEK